MVQSWILRAINATAAAAIAKTGESSCPPLESGITAATETAATLSAFSPAEAALTATEAPAFATTEAPGLATTEAPGLAATEMDAAGLAAPAAAGAALRFTVACGTGFEGVGNVILAV